MPLITVEVPQVGTVEFPEGTPKETMEKAIRDHLGGLQQPKKAPETVVVGQAEGLPGFEVPREEIRAGVEQLPSGVQFAAREALTIGGTAVGGATGALLPVPGASLAGAAGGGLIGETLAQYYGFAPESTGRKVLATVAPLVGAGIVKGAQLGGRVVTNIPFVRNSLKVVDPSAVLTRAGEIGAQIISKTKALGGLMARPAKVLYRSLRRQGVTIGPDDLPATHRALNAMEKRLTPFGNLEEAGKVITLIKSMREHLNAGDIDFETLSIFRKIIGNQIGKFEAAAGTRLGASKKLFGSLLDDVEKLPGPTTIEKLPAGT